jgi:hypothetical protein
MGMKVVDLASMRVVASLDTGRYAVHLAARDDLVAAAEAESGVGLYRLGAAGGIDQVASVPLPGSARGVAFGGSRVYVAAGPAGLLVLSIEDPARPRLIGSFPSENYAHGVAVGGGTILVADGGAGLRLIREGGEGERAAHRLLGRWKSPAAANRVSLRGTTALVAADSAGIRLVDVSDPENPKGH